LLHESSLDHVFASLFYGEYDHESRVITYVNAGHHPPLVVRRDAGGVRTIRLKTDGMPVGVTRDAAYEEMSFVLQPGDLLVAYTDGLTEAGNVCEQWGSERLESVLAECAGKNPAQVVDAVLRRQKSFISPNAADDDMTLMVVSVERLLLGRHPEPAVNPLRQEGRPRQCWS
jgi:sigma-B regulation protein RsbU (phosphoserine phosphatase)